MVNGAKPSAFGQPAGQQQQQPQAAGTSVATGSAIAKYQETLGTETLVMKNGQLNNVSTKQHCITAMKEYEAKSFEELRKEDYMANRKGPQPGGVGQPQQALGGGGMFGAGAAGGSLFGQSNTTMGGNTSIFGQKAGQQAAVRLPAQTGGLVEVMIEGAKTFATPTVGGGLFGQPTASAAAPAFGRPAAGAPAFGAFGQQQQQPAAAAPLFGQQAAATGGGLFGQTSQAPGCFGGFGASAPATSTAGTGGLFGQKPAQTGFGAIGTGGFGQPAAGGLGLGQSTGLGLRNNFARRKHQARMRNHPTVLDHWELQSDEQSARRLDDRLNRQFRIVAQSGSVARINGMLMQLEFKDELNEGWQEVCHGLGDVARLIVALCRRIGYETVHFTMCPYASRSKVQVNAAGHPYLAMRPYSRRLLPLFCDEIGQDAEDFDEAMVGLHECLKELEAELGGRAAKMGEKFRLPHPSKEMGYLKNGNPRLHYAIVRTYHTLRSWGVAVRMLLINLAYIRDFVCNFFEESSEDSNEVFYDARS